MWICDIFHLVRTISSERIMGRPMVFSVTIKIIVSATIAFSRAKQRPIAIVLISVKTLMGPTRDLGQSRVS